MIGQPTHPFAKAGDQPDGKCYLMLHEACRFINVSTGNSADWGGNDLDKEDGCPLYIQAGDISLILLSAVSFLLNLTPPGLRVSCGSPEGRLSHPSAGAPRHALGCLFFGLIHSRPPSRVNVCAWELHEDVSPESLV